MIDISTSRYLCDRTINNHSVQLICSTVIKYYYPAYQSVNLCLVYSLKLYVNSEVISPTLNGMVKHACTT